ncbi:MAG: AtpZ/AtpI family protein [Phycisphaerales bacterium]|jgi:F0F1-type ATP synthase assembly protein I|nr:AtpZ/AtpI family protein [Phycisphaerales bacterium]
MRDPRTEIPSELRDAPAGAHPDPHGLGKHARKPRPDKDMNKGFDPLMKAMAIGMDFAYTVGGGALLGLLIDWLAKTYFTWTAVGAVVGVATGMLRFVREALRAVRAASRKPPE